MKRSAIASLLLTFVTTCLPLAVMAQSVNFDPPSAPPAGTRLSTEYQSQGVVFGAGPTGNGFRSAFIEQAPGKAHSGNQVAYIEQNRCTTDVPVNETWGRLSRTTGQLQLFAREFKSSVSGSVTLEGWAAGANPITDNAIVAQTQTVGPSGWTQLTISRPQPDIAFFRVKSAPGAECTAIDDLTFDVPSTPSPDFSLTAVNPNGIFLPPWSSALASFVIHRFNGSSGNISFVATLPPGIGGVLNPTIVSGGEGSILNLSLTSGPGPGFQSTVTVTGTPTALAGTSPRIVQFQLLVAPVGSVASPLTITDVSPDSSFGDAPDGGANPAGRIKSLVIDPTNDSILYGAADTAGVWKSLNAGKSWRQVSFGLRSGFTSNSTSLAVDGKNPNRLLYATQDNDGRPSKLFGGLWISLDAAASWQHVDLPGCSQPSITSVTFGSGQPFVGTKCGVFTTTDSRLASASWQLLPNFLSPPAPMVLVGAGSQTLFACEGSIIYRSLSLGIPTSTQLAWSLINLGAGNDCYGLAAVPPLGQELQPSSVMVSHASSIGANREITVVNFDTGVTQDLNFSSFASSGSGVDSVFAVPRKSAAAGETRPGFRYDVYAGDSCAFSVYSSPYPGITLWSKLQGGGPAHDSTGTLICNSGSSGIHADTWSMAFPSTYDPSNGVCTAYAATDGGVFVNNTTTPGTPCNPASGWVRAQSGLHVMYSGTMAGVSQQQARPALYLPTGDNDVWGTINGGQSWSFFGGGLGDAGQTFIDPAIPSRVLTARGGGSGCDGKGASSTVKLAISGNSSAPSNGNLSGITCLSGPTTYSGSQPPNQSALSQTMVLPSESAPTEGVYFTVNAAANANDQIVRSTQQDTLPYWSNVSAFFGPGQIGAIVSSGGITTPTIYVLTKATTAPAPGSSPQGGQVYKAAFVNNQITSWTITSTGLNNARGLFVNPYNPNELYVTDLGDSSIKSSVDGGQHWLPQPLLTDIATNHGEFYFGCDTVPFGDTCSLSGMAFDRQNPGLRVAAMYPGGLAFSRDGGINWMELDVTSNLPRPCGFGPCTLAWDLIQFPQSVFYDNQQDPQTGYTSIYMALIGNSVKRVDGPFRTLQSIPLVVCATCLKVSDLGPILPTRLSAVFSNLKSPVSLNLGSDGLYRGHLLVDSSKVSKFSFHFVAGGESTPELSHTFSAAELKSGVAACSPPMLKVSLTPSPVSAHAEMVKIRANVDAKSDCGMPATVQLMTITSNEQVDPGDIRGVRFGSDTRQFELAYKSTSAVGRTYTVLYKATDLFGKATQATAQLHVPHD